MTTRAALHRRVRRRAAVAALLVGLVELSVLAAGAWSLVTAGLFALPVLVRSLGSVLAAVLPWWLGAATLLRHPRVGTATLLTAGAVFAFHLPGVLMAVPWMLAEGGQGRVSIAVAMLRLVLVAAAVTWTWRVRPLVGWSGGGQVPGAAWVLGVLAALTTVTVPYRWTPEVGTATWSAVALPPNLSSAVWAVATAGLYLGAVAVAGKLCASGAGAVLLVVAGPPALVAVSDLLAAMVGVDAAPQPGGIVAVLGLVGLSVLGVRLLLAADPSDASVGGPEHPPSRQAVDER